MSSAPDIPMQRLQSVDKLLGLAACAALQPLRWKRKLAAKASGSDRILLIKFWGIGSLQLLTPAIRALRARHPHAHLTLLTLRENEGFARGLEAFDAVRTLDVRNARGARGWVEIFRRILSLVRDLRRQEFDLVYDFEFFTRFSALVSLATGARETWGFYAPRVWRGGFHTHTVVFNRYWHVARNFRALAGGEDGEDVSFESLIRHPIDPEDTAAVRRKLARAGLGAGRPFVAINPNAGKLSLERRWPSPNFSTLAQRLAIEDGTPVVLIGAASETVYVAEIAARAGPVPKGSLIDLSGELSIGELSALLALASALVTNDTGPMHLAAALGTPTVGLFGPETPVMYRPLGPRTTVLWEPPICSPCINVHDNKVANCIHGRPECLVNITVDAVLEETRLMLWDTILSPVGRARPRPHLFEPRPALALEETGS